MNRPAPGRLRLPALAFVVALALAGCGEEEKPAASVPSTASTTTEPKPERSGPSADGGERPDQPRESPEEQPERPLSVEDVTTAVLTRSGSPEQGCEELVTERFVREAYGDREGCLAARSQGGLARSVRLEPRSDSDGEARVVATPEGGPYDGVEVDVELVRDPELEGAWLVDSLLADVPAGP